MISGESMIFFFAPPNGKFYLEMSGHTHYVLCMGGIPGQRKVGRILSLSETVVKCLITSTNLTVRCYGH